MDKTGQRIHCMGVGGVGVSGVAALLAARGHSVSGCDANISDENRAWLEEHGVRVFTSHDPGHIDAVRPELVVRTPAVAEDNQELARAREAGVEIVRRGEMLARLVGESLGVAICGSHGKTSTSCFTVALLRRLGQAGVGWCIGGSTPSMGGVAAPPADGAPFVVEADESDGTLALYAPRVTVVTSVDADHMEHFASFEALENCFRTVCRATTGRVVYCVENAAACDVAAGIPDALGYGFSEKAALRAQNISCGAEWASFDVFFGDAFAGRATIGVPGRHNVLNALGAVGACLSLGYGAAEAVGALDCLCELPRRRYEVHENAAGIEVVADYSHHPAEIRALVETALLRPHRRLVAVFQPHRHTRTKALGADFPAAFKGVDELLLLPVYAASEKPIAGGESEDLYAIFRQANVKDRAVPLPKLAPSVRDAAAYLTSPVAGLARGDVILVVGAGDIISMVPLLAAAKMDFGGETRSPCAKISYGIGFSSDAYEVVRDEPSLSRALAANPGRVRVLGQGTNLLVSDLGVRDMVVKIGMCGMSIRDDGVTVDVGCGLSGALMLSRLREAGLSGLECMAGIPGTVGGWLAMNAGTRHGAIGDRVARVVAYSADGRRHEASRGECGFAYRRCAFLADKVAASATLVLERSAPAEVAARMEKFRALRLDFSGLRTAGSVFKNPEGTSAGKLLDEAGCKGLRVGGAFVAERHANVIATDDDATASDIAALMALMHRRVLEKFGIDLEREVRIW